MTRSGIVVGRLLGRPRWRRLERVNNQSIENPHGQRPPTRFQWIVLFAIVALFAMIALGLVSVWMAGRAPAVQSGRGVPEAPAGYAGPSR